MRADYFMNIQRNLKVSILGKNYFVATDEHEADVINAAELVNQLAKSKSNKKSELDANVAIIIALELATHLAKKERLAENYEQKVMTLLALVEQAL